jgi:hypothetical protein
MAWQLIYTSAPRSLEAGRSGFGTVARHREIDPLLVLAIERSSQFSRQPGLDLSRVIFNHRIIPLAGTHYHVLSCIHDSGADYTGRTNHLAHHVIADAREIGQLGAEGATPAEVLLGMSWLASWDDHPRYLTSADEIDLRRFHRQTGPNNAAWAHATGSPDHAWLLVHGEASRGAYIVTPPGLELRWLFAESMRLAPDRAWQYSFTTSQQPSDESSDFRWIAFEENTALLRQAESAGRPVLNLCQPKSLPVPEVPYTPAASVAVESATGKRPETPLREVEPSFVISSPLTVKESPTVSRANAPNYPPPPPGTRQGASLRTKIRKADPKRLPWIMAVVAAPIAFAALIFFVVLPFKERHDRRVEISRTLTTSSNFLEGSSEEIAAFLLPRLSDWNRAQMDAKAIDHVAAALILPNLPGIGSGALAADRQRLIDLLQETGGSRITPLSKLSRDFDDVAAILRWSPEFASVKDANDSYQKQTAAIEKTFAEPKFLKLRQALFDLTYKKSVEALLAKLTADNPGPLDGINSFRVAISSFSNHLSPSEEISPRIALANQIIDLWALTEKKDQDENTKRKMRGILDSDKVIAEQWPVWLKRKADAIINVRSLAGSANGASPTQNASLIPMIVQPAPEPNPPTVAVPQPSFAGSKYYCAAKRELPSLEIKEFDMELEFELRGLFDTPIALDYKDLQNHYIRSGKGFAKNGFSINANRLTAEGNSPTEPFTVIARDSKTKSDVFAIYVGLVANDKPIYGVRDTGLVLDGDILTLSEECAKVLGKISQKTGIEVPAGFDGKSAKEQIIIMNQWRANVRPILEDLRRQKNQLQSKNLPPRPASSNATEWFDQKEQTALLTILKKSGFNDSTKGEFDRITETDPVRFLSSVLTVVHGSWSKIEGGEFAKADEVHAAADPLRKKNLSGAELQTALNNTDKSLSKLIDNAKVKSQEQGKAILIAVRSVTRKWAASIQPPPATIKSPDQSVSLQDDLENLSKRSIVDGIFPDGVYTIYTLPSNPQDSKIPLIQFSFRRK